MAKTYRDIAIEEMLGTVEEAMSQAINLGGDLPALNERSDRVVSHRAWEAIDAVEFVRRGHSTDKCM